MVLLIYLMAAGWAESDECEAWIFKCPCNKRRG